MRNDEARSRSLMSVFRYGRPEPVLVKRRVLLIRKVNKKGALRYLRVAVVSHRRVARHRARARARAAAQPAAAAAGAAARARGCGSATGEVA